MVGGVGMMTPFGTRDLFAMFYADPGSGALLWQLIGSFFIGLLFYVRRIATWISPHHEQKRSQDALSHEK